MERNTFKQIIKLSSFYKIDKRRGNYVLPNGSKILDYLKEFIFEYLQKNNLGILKNGKIAETINKKIVVFGGKDEDFLAFEQYERAERLARSMIF